MQTTKTLSRFPELDRTNFNVSHHLELLSLEQSSSHAVTGKVLDRRSWTTSRVTACPDMSEVFVDCDCEQFSRTKKAQCIHICELLDYMHWTDYPWPQEIMQLQRDDSRPTWKRMFSLVNQLAPRVPDDHRASGMTRELSFVIDFPKCSEVNCIALNVFHSKRGKRGKMLKPRPESPNQLLRLHSWTTEEREVLELLEAISSDPYDSFLNESEITLTHAVQPLLLKKVAQLGRLFWTLDDPQDPDMWKPLAWQDEAWESRVQIAEHEEGWRFDAHWRCGETTRPLNDAMLLMAAGIVYFADVIGEYTNAAETFPWLVAIRQSGPFVVPAEDTPEMLKRMYDTHGEIKGLDLPDELSYRSIVGVPSPRAQIGKPERGSRMLSVDVAFIYDDNVAGKLVGKIDHALREVTLRDRDAEATHLETLINAGVQRHENYVLEASALPAVVAFLTAAGWQVEADGKLLRSSGGINITIQSGLDWFDMDGTFDFDGTDVSIPKVLSAMRRGDKFVKLDDGSHGLLPEEWLSRFASVAQLGEADGDTLRFTMPQAVLLDAMLGAQDSVDIDAKYAKYRDKLANFSGIKPARAQKNFKGELRPYQQDGLGWMKFLREFGLGGCLADDMGLGKTIQVLSMLQAERARRPKKGERRLPTLIVVPRSLLFNWAEEAAKFTPNLRVLQYFGMQRAEFQEDFLEYDIIVTTYGIVRRDIEFLIEQSFHYVILDEAQAIKNHLSQASKSCRLLNGRHRLALTGTPVENHLGELWSLFEFLNPGLLGRNEAFMSLARRAGEDEEARQMIAQGIRPFVLRRTKEEVLTDLPQKTENTVHCEMGAEQRRAYDELRDYYRALLNKKVAAQGLNRSKIHVLEALLRLRQCACHPKLLDESSEIPSAKLDTMLAQIESLVAEGHKALIFSQFTKLLGVVRKELDSRNIYYEYLDGRTRKRQERVEAFQDNPNCPLFLISLKAGGHGLNLTAADYVFILDPWWNPAVEAQAVDRAHRIGQEKPVFAYRLICKDTVEEKIVELQNKKRTLADSIINADATLMKSLTAEDLAMLLS